MEVNSTQLKSQENNSEEDYDEYDDYEDIDDISMEFESNNINKHSEIENLDWKFMPQV